MCSRSLGSGKSSPWVNLRTTANCGHRSPHSPLSQWSRFFTVETLLKPPVPHTGPSGEGVPCDPDHEFSLHCCCCYYGNHSLVPQSQASQSVCRPCICKLCDLSFSIKWDKNVSFIDLDAGDGEMDTQQCRHPCHSDRLLVFPSVCRWQPWPSRVATACCSKAGRRLHTATAFFTS